MMIKYNETTHSNVSSGLNQEESCENISRDNDKILTEDMKILILEGGPQWHL